MRTTDSRNGRIDDPNQLPQFELDYLLDDLDNPQEVMVVPRQGPADQHHSRWITMDIEHVVALDAVR